MPDSNLDPSKYDQDPQSTGPEDVESNLDPSKYDQDPQPASPDDTEKSGAGVRKRERQETRPGYGVGDLRILRSPHLEWYFDREAGEWYASYKMPGTDQRVFFNATAEQMDSIFGKNQRPVDFRRRTFQQLSKNQFFSGGIGEVAGDGRFEQEVKRAFELGLDTSDLPEWARGKEVRNLLYIANQEGKSADWLLTQISKTQAFADRFGGGVEQLIKQGNLTLAQGVDAFLKFEANIKQQLLDVGMSANRVTPEVVTNMIKKGQSVEDINFVFEGFKRFKHNRGALDAFNQVLRERGLEPLGKKDQLAFMEGKAPSQLYQIWEEASFNQAAKEAGIDMSVKQAMRLARRTEGHTSLAQAQAGLRSAAQHLLRFGATIEFDKYDIDREDIIDMSVGLAPRSGRSEAEVSRNMERAIGQARAENQDPRFNTQRFRSFSPDGVPQGVSTSRSRTRS